MRLVGLGDLVFGVREEESFRRSWDGEGARQTGDCDQLRRQTENHSLIIEEEEKICSSSYISESS